MTEGDADLGRPPSYVLVTSVTLRKSHTQFDSMPKPLNCPWISELVSFPSRRNAEFMPVFIPLKTLVKNRGKSSRLISLCRRRPPTSRLGGSGGIRTHASEALLNFTRSFAFLSEQVFHLFQNIKKFSCSKIRLHSLKFCNAQIIKSMKAVSPKLRKLLLRGRGESRMTPV